MISTRMTAVIISILALALASCSGDDRITSGRTVNKDSRFVLMQGQWQLKSGQLILITLRMDSISGETWVLSDGETLKWETVQDNLKPIYKKDPKTNKWGLGIGLPDGRDINDLSKEELIRIVQSMLRAQQNMNPNDPLGSRGDSSSTKPK